MMSNVEKDLNGNVKHKKTLTRFPEDLIVRETVPGQDIAEELKLIVQSSENIEVNCLNEYGHTALSTAAFVGSMKCCRILVELGAEVEKRDEDGWTAMHYAMAKGYLDIVKYFILCGGDLYVKNNDGDTPLDFVEDNEIKEILLACYEKYSQS
ncbi:Protein phosphatase 1 regulatory subunit 27 [Stylophora pistillata]|uniref:Protein phosphatase 1 regulatory subunit 27 n=2 Tax=Stylophora pistillata TaxID=50429 RepID=A0A2B4SZW4_STYPI|nr:Protein phosphatase 1 regulatory subunit 27 [Stylophora pistillata]